MAGRIERPEVGDKVGPEELGDCSAASRGTDGHIMEEVWIELQARQLVVGSDGSGDTPVPDATHGATGREGVEIVCAVSAGEPPLLLCGGPSHRVPTLVPPASDPPVGAFLQDWRILQRGPRMGLFRSPRRFWGHQ